MRTSEGRKRLSQGLLPKGSARSSNEQRGTGGPGLARNLNSGPVTWLCTPTWTSVLRTGTGQWTLLERISGLPTWTPRAISTKCGSQRKTSYIRSCSGSAASGAGGPALSAGAFFLPSKRTVAFRRRSSHGRSVADCVSAAQKRVGPIHSAIPRTLFHSLSTRSSGTHRSM